MNEKQKDYIIRRWNLCQNDKRIRLAADVQVKERQLPRHELVAIP